VKHGPDPLGVYIVEVTRQVILEFPDHQFARVHFLLRIENSNQSGGRPVRL
jgi:hypothetical protein